MHVFLYTNCARIPYEKTGKQYFLLKVLDVTLLFGKGAFACFADWDHNLGFFGTKACCCAFFYGSNNCIKLWILNSGEEGR